jgi:hypothetical protein
LSGQLVFAGAPENAAELYHKALQAVPMSPEDLARLEDPKRPPEASRTLLAKGTNALKLMHLASAVPKCDWGMDISDPSSIHLSFLHPLPVLWGIAELQVNASMASGKADDVAAIISDLLLMARRIQGIGLLLTRLQGCDAEIGAINVAARYLPQLDADSVRHLRESYQSLPSPPSLKEVLAAERAVSSLKVKHDWGPRLGLREQRMDVIRAMFLAVLKSPDGGSEFFRRMKDPVDGKPFGYQALPHGYQLSSELQFDGKPVTLVVGKSEEK